MNADEKMDLLREVYGEWKDCTRCGLCNPSGRERTNVVFGEGNPDARVLIVGEAPGAYEDATGHPFQGESGKVLDKFLDACCSDRDEVFITNVVGCRPTEEDKPKVNRKPSKEEIKACFPRLSRIIEIVDPHVVILLGQVALKTLTNEKQNIAPVARGKPGPALEVTTPGTMIDLTRPGFATFHPSFLLRAGMPMGNGGDVHKAYVIFQKAFRMADTYDEIYHGTTPPQREKHG